MTGQGWVTGSDIVSRPPTKEYREGWERIFGRKESLPEAEKPTKATQSQPSESAKE